MKKHLSNIEGTKEEIQRDFINEFNVNIYGDDNIYIKDDANTVWYWFESKLEQVFDTAKQQAREEIIEDLEIIRMKAIDKNTGIDALLDKLHSQTKEK